MYKEPIRQIEAHIDRLISRIDSCEVPEADDGIIFGDVKSSLKIKLKNL